MAQEAKYVGQFDDMNLSEAWENYAMLVGYLTNTYKIPLSQIKSLFDAITELIPSAATPLNQLADKAYVDFGVEQMAAKYLSADAQGNPFSSYQAFEQGPFYYAGSIAIPTKNDYALVNGDETHDGAITRYWYNGTSWDFQYVVNNTPLNQEQLDALNSTINATKVSNYESHIANTTIHVTSQNKQDWNAKYDKPVDGIPKTDLDNSVQTSLGKADTSMQPVSGATTNNFASFDANGNVQDSGKKASDFATPDSVNLKEDSANKETTLTESSNTKFPTSKAVADFVVNYSKKYVSNSGEFFTSSSQLPTTDMDVGNFAFVTGTDSNGNTYLDMYMYSRVDDGGSITYTWVKEFRLINNTLTTAQFSALNSGITSALRTKLDNIESGAEVNVQSDWNESNSSNDAFVKNKPTKLSDFTDDLAKDNVPVSESNKYVKSGGVYSNEQVLVESINEIRKDVDALKDIKRFDTFECNTIQSMSIPKVGDSEMILNGVGAPSLEPEFVGQAYLDTTNNILYYAFGTETTSWKSSQPTEIITDSVVNEIWNSVFV